MKKIFRSIVAIALSIIFCFTLCVPALATLGESENYSIMRGDSECSLCNIGTVEEQFVSVINSATNQEQRENLILKAVYTGVSVEDLDEVILSNDELALINSYKVQNINESPSRYILTMTIRKQEHSDWCSAGTVKTVLMQINSASPSQQTIMNHWQSYYGVTYPALYMLRDYINNRLYANSYIIENYGGTETTFKNKLLYDLDIYWPSVILMACPSGSTNPWPYHTSGHFCTVMGYGTNYTIGDPYYFSDYVSSATANNGKHTVTWNTLNTAIAQKGYYIMW